MSEFKLGMLMLKAIILLLLGDNESTLKQENFHRSTQKCTENYSAEGNTV